MENLLFVTALISLIYPSASLLGYYVIPETSESTSENLLTILLLLVLAISRLTVAVLVVLFIYSNIDIISLWWFILIVLLVSTQFLKKYSVRLAFAGEVTMLIIVLTTLLLL